MDRLDDLMARLEALSDRDDGNIAVEIIEAARQLDRQHLDDVAVDVYSLGSDEDRRQKLVGKRRTLSDLIAKAGLTLPHYATLSSENTNF